MPIPPTIFDSDDTAFVPARGMENGAQSASKRIDRKSRAPQLDGSADPTAYITPCGVVPFSPFWRATERVDEFDWLWWASTQIALHALDQRGGEHPDGLTSPAPDFPFIHEVNNAR